MIRFFKYALDCWDARQRLFLPRSNHLTIAQQPDFRPIKSLIIEKLYENQTTFRFNAVMFTAQYPVPSA